MAVTKEKRKRPVKVRQALEVLHNNTLFVLWSKSEATDDEMEFNFVFRGLMLKTSFQPWTLKLDITSTKKRKRLLKSSRLFFGSIFENTG